jgi:hypothetical protein
LIFARVFQTVLTVVVLGFPIAVWAVGGRSQKGANQKQSAGRRAAVILLGIQTLLPLAPFSYDMLTQVGSAPIIPWSGQIIFFSALLGEVLTIPLIWMWVRYGLGKERWIGGLISVLCALFILLLVMVGGATA